MTDDEFIETLALEIGADSAHSVSLRAAELASLAQKLVASEPGSGRRELTKAFETTFDDLSSKPYMTPALVALAASRASAALVSALADRLGFDAVALAEAAALNAGTKLPDTEQ